MARPAGDPTQLINRLNAALINAQKQRKTNRIADAGLMAEIAGMTWRNLVKTYIEPDPEFPIISRGAEGVAWQFDVVKVLKHMIARAQAKIDVNRRRVADRAALLNFTVPDEEDALGFAEIGRLADLTYRMMDEQRTQGTFVKADRHRMVVGGVLLKVRDAVQGCLGRIDPAGKLPPPVREALEHELKEILLACHRDATSFLGELSAPLQPPRNRRAPREARAR